MLGCSKAEAEWANAVFERNMQDFLRAWIKRTTPDALPVEKDNPEIYIKALVEFYTRNEEQIGGLLGNAEAFENAIRGQMNRARLETQAHTKAPQEEYIQGRALRDFFARNVDAVEQLLADPEIAKHLTRRESKVYFDPETADPLFSVYEERFYNLAAQHQRLLSKHFNSDTPEGISVQWRVKAGWEPMEVTARYLPSRKQGAYGDRIKPEDLDAEDMPSEMPKADISDHFYTRRAHPYLIDLQKHKVIHSGRHVQVPLHIISEDYVEDSLQKIRKITEGIRESGDTQQHYFVFQQRHSKYDAHLGSGMLIMDPAHPERPVRTLFCDTFVPARSLAEPHFKARMKAVFGPEAADHVEDVSHPLQLDNGVVMKQNPDKIYLQDINCSFYTADMAGALVKILEEKPETIRSATREEILASMRDHTPDYYMPGETKPIPPDQMRETLTEKRWDAGRTKLLAVARLAQQEVRKSQNIVERS